MEPVTTEIGRVKCWISTERLAQKEVLDRETGMVYNVKTTTTTTTTTWRNGDSTTALPALDGVKCSQELRMHGQVFWFFFVSLDDKPAAVFTYLWTSDRYCCDVK